MKRRLLLVNLLFITVYLFSYKIALPMGPTLVSVLPITEGRIASEGNYEFVHWKSFDEAIAMVASRQVSAILLPVSYGATLHDKGLPVKLVAVTLWNSFFCVSDGWDYTGIASLRSQTLYFAQGKGQTADVVLRILLKAKGLDPDRDLSMKYLSPPEIVAFFQKGLATLAIVPEPYASLILNLKPKASIAFDLQTLWQETLKTSFRLPVTGLFYVPAANEPPSQTKDQVNTLRQDFQKATGFLSNHLEEMAALATSVFPGMAEGVILRSIGNSEYDFSFSEEDKKALIHYFDTISRFLPESLPAVPDEDFYLF